MHRKKAEKLLSCHQGQFPVEKKNGVKGRTKIPEAGAKSCWQQWIREPFLWSRTRCEIRNILFLRVLGASSTFLLASQNCSERVTAMCFLPWTPPLPAAQLPPSSNGSIFCGYSLLLSPWHVDVWGQITRIFSSRFPRIREHTQKNSSLRSWTLNLIL